MAKPLACNGSCMSMSIAQGRNCAARRMEHYGSLGALSSLLFASAPLVNNRRIGRSAINFVREMADGVRKDWTRANAARVCCTETDRRAPWATSQTGMELRLGLSRRQRRAFAKAICSILAHVLVRRRSSVSCNLSEADITIYILLGRSARLLSVVNSVLTADS